MNSTSAAPASALISMTGTSCGTLAEPKSGPDRSSLLPSLKMITASAPASTAFAIFSEKKHVPRWISAMSPVKSAKSASSQPAFEVPSGWPTGNGTTLSLTPCTTPDTVPLPE
jgi:hypothetical protein